MTPYIIMLYSSLVGTIIGFFLFFLASRIFLSFKMRRRVELSQASQEEAEALLKKRGFKIIGKQKRADIITYIDGKPNLGFIQADFLVEKEGKKYVAEVKAGELVSNPLEPSTRRQLLEYKFAYKPYGILLVNMLDKTIHKIDFEFPSYSVDKIFRLILTALVVTGQKHVCSTKPFQPPSMRRQCFLCMSWEHSKNRENRLPISMKRICIRR